MIQYVCDMAQMEYGTCEDVTQIKNYYVLVLMMAGMIDDLQECLNEIIRAKDIPISIVIVKVGA
jgi:hypothetical protein